MRCLRPFISAFALAAIAGTAAAVLSSCSPITNSALENVDSRAYAPPSMLAAAPSDYPGIHNAVAFHKDFFSGSVPDGDTGFCTLAAMGVKTIITVDGAEPDTARAAAQGIRYIHLPFSYGGFDEARKLELTRAVRDAMGVGGVYIHCHHGKHRSASAAAAVAVGLGWMGSQEAVERMKVSGTAPNYKGLYACAAEATRLDPRLIDSVSPDFPAISPASGFTKSMVEIDEISDHLKAIEKANWKAPADHPDLVPAAEAGRMADLLRVLIEGNYAKRKPDAFTTLLRDNSSKAQTLEDLLLAGEKDPAKLSSKLKLISASCKDCHAKYRD